MNVCVTLLPLAERKAIAPLKTLVRIRIHELRGQTLTSCRVRPHKSNCESPGRITGLCDDDPTVGEEVWVCVESEDAEWMSGTVVERAPERVMTRVRIHNIGIRCWVNVSDVYPLEDEDMCASDAE